VREGGREGGGRMACQRRSRVRAWTIRPADKTSGQQCEGEKEAGSGLGANKTSGQQHSSIRTSYMYHYRWTNR